MREELKIFEHPDFGIVRTDMIDGEAWFCGEDVCRALGYIDACGSIEGNCKSEWVTKRTVWEVIVNKGDGNSEKRSVEMDFINEFNLFRLIWVCQVEWVGRFERWVCDNVLPLMRRTGRYTPSKMPADFDLGRLLDVVVGTADAQDRFFLYEWYKWYRDN